MKNARHSTVPKRRTTASEHASALAAKVVALESEIAELRASQARIADALVRHMAARAELLTSASTPSVELSIEATYEEVVAAFREMVIAASPAGAIVVVASKGDSALIELADRIGWHFLRDDNAEYAGYHPANGAHAVEQLDQLRSQGAGWFGIPCFMRWWLDHYTELADHLANESTRVVEEDGVGMLFELRPHRLSSVALGSSTATSSVSAVDFQLHSLREAVLPPDASWVTLSRAVGGFLEGHQAAPIVSEPDAPLSGTDLIDRLEGLRRRGAEYLVIPAEESEWLETQVAFRRYLNRFRTVVAQRRICSIFELGQCPGVQTEPPTSSPNLTSEQSESV